MKGTPRRHPERGALDRHPEREGAPAPEREGSRPARVGVISLGCPKNLVDTEVMLGHLLGAGCELVRDPEEADVLVVNTCGFIDAARRESVRTILEAAAGKERGRLRRLIVAGCLVQRYAQELSEALPEVDAFVGLDEIERVAEIAGLARSGAPEVRTHLPMVSATAKPRVGGPRRTTATLMEATADPGPASYLYDDTTPRVRATPPWTAFIKIAEGCDHTCAFCAIPSFRGRFRSRRPESVVEEAREMARSGVREVSLIAQDSSRYGRDLGLVDGLAALLARLDAVEGLRWIRVHYLYPNTVTDRLIEVMAERSRVVEYVDLPLQHAHPAVLGRMRRGGSAETHLRLLERFRRAMPEAALRSTFIVGFPGETEEEFATLLDFLREARLDHVGAFCYSHEEGTPAHGTEDDVPRGVKAHRLRRLMATQQRIAFERLQRFVGREIEVLVEGAHPETEHLLVGRTRTQAPDVDGRVLLNDGFAAPGEFARVKITGTAGYDLVGSLLGAG